MRRPFRYLLASVAAFLAFGCAGLQKIHPAPTAAATSTTTSTSLPTTAPSAIMPAPTRTPSQTPVPSETAPRDCLAADGVWESEEEGFFGPILTFRVKACAVVSIEVWVYVVDGELYMTNAQSPMPIEEEAFAYEEASGEGRLVLAGVFDSASESHGTMTFTRGFDIFGTVLSGDVVIPWNASPL